MTIAQSTKLAFIQAVTTHHTTTVIDAMRLEVDAGCLAIFCAKTAIPALVGIEVNLQPRETGKEAQHRSYWADGVTVSSPTSPSKNGHDDEGRSGNDERRQ